MRQGHLALVLAAVAVLGCKEKAGVPASAAPGEPAVQAPAPAGTESGAKAPLRGVKGAPDEPTVRVASNCPEGRRIESGDTSSPAGTVYLAYQAALRGDDPEAFATFFGLFVPGKRIEEVRRDVWGRVREHVGKYTASADDAAYTLCRSVPVSEGRVKVFVKCNDPQKSDSPIVLQNVDGAWKIDVITP
jgi:hypothetical protein